MQTVQVPIVRTAKIVLTATNLSIKTVPSAINRTETANLPTVLTTQTALIIKSVLRVQTVRTAAAPAVRKEAIKNSARTARPLKSQPTIALG